MSPGKRLAQRRFPGGRCGRRATLLCVMAAIVIVRLPVRLFARAVRVKNAGLH